MTIRTENKFNQDTNKTCGQSDRRQRKGTTTCSTDKIKLFSVQFSYRIYVSRSLIIKIMTAALTRSLQSKTWTMPQFGA